MEELRKYYEILGLARSARPEAIKAVYQRLIQLYHPDRASDTQKDEFERIAKDINKAYEILGNASSRSAYDSKLDEGASASEAAAESYSRTYTESSESESSDRHPDHVHRASGRDDRNNEYTKYGEFNRSELQQLYVDAKKYVIGAHVCTKKGLKRRLRDDGVNPRLLDELAEQFLDQMCRDDILSKRTGGKTTYRFKRSSDEDDFYEDDAESDADYDNDEEGPASSARIAKAQPKNPSGQLILILSLIVAGWWGWHHFVSNPATQASEGSTPSAVPLHSHPVIESQATQDQRPGGIGAQTSSAMGSALAVEPTSTPLLDSNKASPSSGSTANADVTAQREDIPPAPPSVDWRIVRETPPTFPVSALRAGEFGTAVVAVELDGAGNIIQARVRRSSGYRDLDMAAVRAVRTFEFAPMDGTSGGQGSTVLVPINFQQQ